MVLRGTDETGEEGGGGRGEERHAGAVAERHADRDRDCTGRHPPPSPSVPPPIMGNRGSTSNGPHTDEQAEEDVADYYALLQVDENATTDEIRVRRQRSTHMHRRALTPFSAHFASSLSFTTPTRTLMI